MEHYSQSPVPVYAPAWNAPCVRTAEAGIAQFYEDVEDGVDADDVTKGVDRSIPMGERNAADDQPPVRLGRLMRKSVG